MADEEAVDQQRRPFGEFIRTGTGVLTSVAGVVGAVATLVAVGSQTGLFGSDSKGGSATPPAVADSSDKRMNDRSLSGNLLTAASVDPPAIRLRIPEEWSWRDEQFNPVTSAEPGIAVRAAAPADIDSGAATDRFGAATIYVGASKKFAREILAEPGKSIQAKLRSYLRTEDWGGNGCQALGDAPLHLGAVTGLRRKWVDCKGRGYTVQEFVGIDPRRCYAVGGQTFSATTGTQQVLDRVISSIRVNAALLPGSCEKP